MSQSYLFLSTARNSWGRSVIASTIASDLVCTGSRVTIFTHRALEPLFSSSGAHLATFGSSMGPLLAPYLNSIMSEVKPDIVVLCDFFSNANVFASEGLNLTHCLQPISEACALDLWDYDRTGYNIDMFGESSFFLGSGSQIEWERDFRAIRHKIKPVPIVAPLDTSSSFSNLPPNGRLVSGKDQRHALGLSSGDRAVLFCSAEWQHSHYKSEAGRRLAEALPRLVAGYLAQLGPAVHLVHVGPKTLELDALLGERYHWLPSVSPDAFDNIIASSDLFLTPNISATTITKALVSGVPVVALQNSLVGDTLEAICAQLPFCVSPFLADWIRSALPLYPFSMWPLGYHAFLAPLLANNPYAEAFDILELLHQPTIHHTLQNLLFSPAAKEEQLHKHALYLAQVRALPTGAQRIHQLIGV